MRRNRVKRGLKGRLHYVIELCNHLLQSGRSFLQILALFTQELGALL